MATFTGTNHCSWLCVSLSCSRRADLRVAAAAGLLSAIIDEAANKHDAAVTEKTIVVVRIGQNFFSRTVTGPGSPAVRLHSSEDIQPAGHSDRTHVLEQRWPGTGESS